MYFSAVFLFTTVSWAEQPASLTSQELAGPSIGDTEDPSGIINGMPANTDEWPETGALLLEADFFGQSFMTVACSSTLIAPDVVLLAAHCIDPSVYAQQGIDISSSTLYWTRSADPSDR